MPVNDDVEVRDRTAEKRLKAVAKVTGVAGERLTILSESEARLPNVGAEVTMYKVVDRESGDSWRVALDARGRPQDVDELLAKEQSSARDRFGAMQEALHELAELRGSEDDSVPVMLRYATDEEPIDLDKRELDGPQLAARRFAALGEQARRLERQVLRRAQALHREVFEAHKIDAKVAGKARVSGPFVRSRVPLKALAELARDERISFIGLDGEKEVLDYPTIPESLPTTRTDSVHGAGFRGAGVKIAVLESGGLWSRRPVSRSVRPGLGPGRERPHDEERRDHRQPLLGRRLLRVVAGLRAGRERAAGQRVRLPGPLRLGARPGRQRGHDELALRHRRVERRASQPGRVLRLLGDALPLPDRVHLRRQRGRVGSVRLGKGYNFLGVGNVVNDGDGDRCNDVISGDSSHKNPISPHSDHEVPGIAAPGSRHDLLGSSFGGTSCATPVTAAISALLMSANTSLKIWPEAIRAILLATANYQRADGADYSKYADGADNTVLVNAYFARPTASKRESGTTPQFRAHDYGLMTASDFRGGMFTKEWKAQTYSSRSRIRVALTWNSKVAASGGVPSSSVLNADLDLWVYDPDGLLIAASTTWDNSWEFVEFTPSKTGVYTIKVRGYSVPSDFSSWYGVAWTTHYDLC